MKHKIQCTRCKREFDWVPGMESSVSDPTDIDTNDDRYGDHPRWLGHFCPECLPIVLEYIAQKRKHAYLLAQIHHDMWTWIGN